MGLYFEENDGTGLIAHDPWLAPHADAMRRRYAHYRWVRSEIERQGGILGPISQGHRYFGFNRGERNGEPGVWYREWAPAAHSLALIGDFNGWDRNANPMQRDEWGVWSLFLPDSAYRGRLIHGSRVKVHVVTQDGGMDRLPAYSRRVVQEDGTHFTTLYWEPEPFFWQHPTPEPIPERRGGLRIYEAHVGMAQEEGRIGTFEEFTRNNLPRIVDLGYNAIQLMAIMEHPFYGSFGYHVSNFYAVSSRFGTPEDLKRLIDTAHGMGLRVIMDLIHSHAVKNVLEGLNRFDGTDYQYFHAGGRGQHPAWDSLLFDYSRYEVLRFLLSNVRFWLEEFHFDGFRFDGVTSMIYHDHGLGRPFTSYEDYYSDNVDWDALVYLMLANELLHTVNPQAISIAEEVSGMPGLARPVAEGGVGFDYRLAMGVPDYWIKLLKERSDEDWNLGELYHTLLNRRRNEKHIGYAESHDQALVGDKTIAFWLMDQEMYWNMSRFRQSLIIDRGIALHKMIRLITFSLAGEGYLNFMGNEFGHPEWVDFPRPGNNYSYHYARRQWSLVERDDLRYKGLYRFDQAMQALDQRFGILEDPLIEQLALHEDTRQLIYRRGPLVFAFNFHPTESYFGLRIPVPDPTDYRVVLDTDALRFEGHGRSVEDQLYPVQPVPMYGRAQSVQIYLPSRSAQVLAPVGLSGGCV
ncbi:MAG: alpha-amylase family glycosyl hydrolase [Chloroherpetonaceae bacterium]|nr:alpha-amylase family glycosyl hydrolase [Chthonomonadaceae bacterium]MDW8208671.1 alpha-amylase family glycosyl hydrolase [Chloroherpetonaceae bacterium]